MKVLVIGGGTGGLAWPTVCGGPGSASPCYERDRARADGLHGYRVGIDPDGSRALHACLPPELFDTFVATCARDPNYFNIVTEDLEVLSLAAAAESTDPVDSEKSVSRMTLRQVLLTGLEDVVTSARTSPATSSATTARSPRTSRTAPARPATAGGRRRHALRGYAASTCRRRCRETGIIAIAGKLPLTAESAKLCRRRCSRASRWSSRRRAGCILHVMEFKWDRDGSVKSGIGGDTDATSSGAGPACSTTTPATTSTGASATARKFPAEHHGAARRGTRPVALELTPAGTRTCAAVRSHRPRHLLSAQHLHLGAAPALADEHRHAARRRDPHHDAGPRRRREHRPARRGETCAAS